MILKEVFKKETANNCRLLDILERYNGKTIELFFEYTLTYKNFLNLSAGAFPPVWLIPAPENGEKPEIVPGISRNLPEHSTYVQEVFTNWYTDVFREVEIVHYNLHEQKIKHWNLFLSFS